MATASLCVTSSRGAVKAAESTLPDVAGKVCDLLHTPENPENPDQENPGHRKTRVREEFSLIFVVRNIEY
jgi:hypothetical protein